MACHTRARAAAAAGRARRGRGMVWRGEAGWCGVVH